MLGGGDARNERDPPGFLGIPLGVSCLLGVGVDFWVLLGGPLGPGCWGDPPWALGGFP